MLRPSSTFILPTFSGVMFSHGFILSLIFWSWGPGLSASASLRPWRTWDMAFQVLAQWTRFYPRPVLVFVDFRWLPLSVRVCVRLSVCVCVRDEFCDTLSTSPFGLHQVYVCVRGSQSQACPCDNTSPRGHSPPVMSFYNLVSYTGVGSPGLFGV